MTRQVLIGLCLAAMLLGWAATAPAQETAPVRPPPGVGTRAAPVVTPAPVVGTAAPETPPAAPPAGHGTGQPLDLMSMVFVFMLATFIGVGVIRRVSRLLHTPLMSITNAISAIAVVGAIIVAGMEPAHGGHYPGWIRFLGAVAVFASMTNIISGFLITDRMLKMFRTREGGRA